MLVSGGLDQALLVHALDTYARAKAFRLPSIVTHVTIHDDVLFVCQSRHFLALRVIECSYACVTEVGVSAYDLRRGRDMGVIDRFTTAIAASFVISPSAPLIPGSLAAAGLCE